MRRSEVNALVRSAAQCFEEHGWALPPEPRWRVTDFGLGRLKLWGLVLLRQVQEPEYAEDLAYLREGMVVPAHFEPHLKKELLCRHGVLAIQLWPGDPVQTSGAKVPVKIDGDIYEATAGDPIALEAGERMTLEPGVIHEYSPASPECILTLLHGGGSEDDTVFVNPDVRKKPEIEEDELPSFWLETDIEEAN
ncbi:MAG: D-lyxose/D-mannose family sugar isomerase [Fimbriimonadaceae bacterium]|nr:MAG: D-lyxose/D-mannose family sugar isomerase [Fimbriimonadaceae bacterium]